ncbi:Fe-S cluster assembly protein HesB [Chlorobaculum thiosulfatiphilum]|uniref:DNA-(apurinic or apyrimidinic site) lyase n=1 Tax=Chlorobaculum thiosulfatiphilum TaxID=115852 RepID=A0A5C4SBT2_CHLTI|nr:DNA glycosylase [Chlorobaculum thiosulfatiphilum]TNJ40211.1 Fe-S cluster assembly protein HesB [Chlorobaculum thiosulfatiphilum]
MSNKLFKSILKTDNRLDLKQTLFSGQSFTWKKIDLLSAYYVTKINKTIIFLREIEPGIIEALSSSKKINGLPINQFLFNYFSLEIDDIKVFPQRFKNDFPEVWRRVEPYHGVRIMRQDPFEIMVTFMCAQGIGMHLIRRQVSMIAEGYGQKVGLEMPEGEMIFHCFPIPSALASADPDELALCTNNNRIRAANIIAMARSFESGKLALALVGSGECDLETLRETLCAHSGIGLKIADCIALFGFGRFDTFPIDTHVKQYLWEWFGIEAARKSLTEKNYRYLQKEARKILGNEYAGYAGHMLFHCWRKEIKKMKAF